MAGGKAGRLVAGALALGAILGSAPAYGQVSMEGRAVVTVPAVASLELVEATPGSTRTLSGGVLESGGTIVLEVRTNVPWRVVVTSISEVSWRVVPEADHLHDDFHRLGPGGEAEISGGERGRTRIRIDYRWAPTDGQSPTAVPLTYTLATL